MTKEKDDSLVQGDAHQAQYRGTLYNVKGDCFNLNVGPVEIAQFFQRQLYWGISLFRIRKLRDTANTCEIRTCAVNRMIGYT